MAGSSGAHERKARAPRPAVRSSAVLLPRNGERVFPLSNMAINQLLRGMRPGGGVVPHGFRSTFRDWAAERMAYPSDVVEMALAHATKSKTEAAYRPCASPREDRARQPCLQHAALHLAADKIRACLRAQAPRNRLRDNAFHQRLHRNSNFKPHHLRANKNRGYWSRPAVDPGSILGPEQEVGVPDDGQRVQ